MERWEGGAAAVVVAVHLFVSFFVAFSFWEIQMALSVMDPKSMLVADFAVAGLAVVVGVFALSYSSGMEIKLVPVVPTMILAAAHLVVVVAEEVVFLLVVILAVVALVLFGFVAVLVFPKTMLAHGHLPFVVVFLVVLAVVAVIVLVSAAVVLIDHAMDAFSEGLVLLVPTRLFAVAVLGVDLALVAVPFLLPHHLVSFWEIQFVQTGIFQVHHPEIHLMPMAEALGEGQ